MWSRKALAMRSAMTQNSAVKLEKSWRLLHSRETGKKTVKMSVICRRYHRMSRTNSKIRFKARLLQPADNTTSESWTFIVLPQTASAKLPSRGMTAVEGTINAFPFQAVLEPDGQKSHWLKVDRKLRQGAGARAGDVVALEIAPAANEREPEVPPDLRKALAAATAK